jgi:hypothetical protein
MFQARLDHAERAEYTLFAQSIAAVPRGLDNALKGIVESMVPAEGIEPTA